MKVKKIIRNLSAFIKFCQFLFSLINFKISLLHFSLFQILAMQFKIDGKS